MKGAESARWGKSPLSVLLVSDGECVRVEFDKGVEERVVEGDSVEVELDEGAGGEATTLQLVLKP